MTKQTVGVIGVGMMGHGIARNIQKKGWPLAYLDHPGNQPSDDLDADGAKRFDDASALAAACDVLILCVTGSPQIEALLLGPDSVTAALRPGTIVVDCSTGIPSATMKAAEAVKAVGCEFVDAAMTRTPKEAEEGRLNLLIGGDMATVEALTPLFEAFSENRFHAGGIGRGQTLKLLHNFVSLGSVTLIAEAAACAAENDIAPEVLVDCLRRGGGYGAGLDRTAPYILDGDVTPMRFSNSNARKDLTYYSQLVEETGTSRKVAEGVRGALDWLVETGHGDEMMPTACTTFRKKDT